MCEIPTIEDWNDSNKNKKYHKMKKYKQPSQAQLQMQVDAFNFNFKVGEIVNVKTDSGETVKDTIKHHATIMGGHTPMAWLENKGSYILDRVSKI